MAVYISFSACGSILNGSASGSLSSPNFPALFPSRQTQGCSWTIRVPSGRIKLIFHNFSLEERGNSNCVAAQGARLRITNVASDDNQAKFTLCGPTLPFPVYSTGNFMSLTLVSATNNVPGFNASYETITDEMCKCLVKILMISNSNWTEWSTIQGIIGRVISKSAEREAQGRFEITSLITP